jgi:diguanylate cyclase (GGDEF)-like protein
LKPGFAVSIFLRFSRQLTTKLALLVTTAMMVAMVALGVYFDVFLRESFLDATRVRMQHAYQRLAYNLNSIEVELKEGAAFAAKDEQLIASVELINRYQDKTRYSIALIDEEKKMLALELLARVKLSLHSDMALYDQDEELIAFANLQAGAYQVGYVSFVQGAPQIMVRQESEREYQAGALPTDGNISAHHVAHIQAEKSLPDGVTTYLQRGDTLVIKSHQSVVDTEGGRRMAHLELSHMLDSAYFAQFSKDTDIELTQAFESPLAAQAILLNGRTDVDSLRVSQTPEQYLGVMKKDTLGSPVYFTVALDKTRENALVNTQRVKLFLLLVAIAAGVLLFMRFVFQRSLAHPLGRLMAQIRQIRQGNYAEVHALSTGDELEEVSVSVNTLAQAVAQREAALEQARRDEEYRANHDALTGLPNRRYFSQRLAQALHVAQTQQGELALVFMDVDQFKLINDTLGHAVGDQLLLQIGQRMQRNVRPGDTLARIGGDEFTVLIEGVNGRSEVGQIVAQYLALFHAPFMCGDHEISATVSIGIARHPQDGLDSLTLLKHADLALYKAKDNGRDNFCFFSADLSQRASDRADMIHALKLAIEAGDQFVLHYQPKVSTATGNVVAAEALIRWNSPEMGLVPPFRFIALAEESRQIIPIGDWVIQQACHDLAQLNALGIDLQHLSMNVSNVQLRGHDLLAVLRQAIGHNELHARQLELEITESYIAKDAGLAIESLHAFRALGLQLAIDDFGTGYSSMSYLKSLPFTRLKIDKSFVDGLPQDQDSVAITRAIIALAKNFGLAVTAEGVERADQLAFLQQAQCDEIQGYYYARPMPLAAFVDFCRGRQTFSAYRASESV